MIINLHNTFLQIKNTKRTVKNIFTLFLNRFTVSDNKTNLNDIKIKELIESLNTAQIEWKCASINFNYAYEDELIDYYVYKIKATQIKYDFLLKKAKEHGL